MALGQQMKSLKMSTKMCKEPKQFVDMPPGIDKKQVKKQLSFQSLFCRNPPAWTESLSVLTLKLSLNCRLSSGPRKALKIAQPLRRTYCPCPLEKTVDRECSPLGEAVSTRTLQIRELLSAKRTRLIVKITIFPFVTSEQP